MMNLRVLCLLLACCVSPAYAFLPVIDISAIVQLAHQLNQLKEQSKYLQAELKQLGSTQYRWGQTQALVDQLQGLVEHSRGLASDTAALDQQFRAAYPGYQAPHDFSQSYQQNTQRLLQTLNGVSQAMAVHGRDFKNENTRLTFLQQQAQHAQGQTQAIQASSQLTSEAVSQLQLLRQSILAQSKAQLAYYATQTQEAASAHAELAQVIKGGATQVPLDSGPRLTLPQF